jgi:hypothetical protein
MAACLEDELVPSPEPTGPTVSPKQLARAERDLDWWFGVRESQLGVHGAGFEPGGGPPDQSVIDDKIVRLFDAARIAAVRRHYRVAHVLRRMTPEHIGLAGDLYRPRPAAPALHVVFAAPALDGASWTSSDAILTVTGLVPRTAPFRVEYAAHAMSKRLGPLEWLAYVCRPRVEKGRAINSKLPGWISRARSEAFAIRRAVLIAYGEAAAASR